jgi:RNA polymerase sigma factor
MTVHQRHRGGVMKDAELNQLLEQAKAGDELVRERLIRRYKPYIINTVGHICKRYISWSDEESSIGLLAFNRSIETFESGAGRTFTNYVYLLINRDLIDFFRREKHQKHDTLDYFSREVTATTNIIEIEKSLEAYQLNFQSSELVEEIIEMDQYLAAFEISFEELEEASPKHKETRNVLMNMAMDFVKDEELVEHFLKKNRFPTTSFTKKTGYPTKTIERFRKYLITLVVLLLHPEWIQLSAFIQVLPRNEGS